MCSLIFLNVEKGADLAMQDYVHSTLLCDLLSLICDLCVPCECHVTHLSIPCGCHVTLVNTSLPNNSREGLERREISSK